MLDILLYKPKMSDIDKMHQYDNYIQTKGKEGNPTGKGKQFCCVRTGDYSSRGAHSLINTWPIDVAKSTV